MDIINYFETNFSIDNLIGNKDDRNIAYLKHIIETLNSKYDFKIPPIEYVVSYVGLNVLNAIEDSKHYSFLLENTTKDTFFLFRKKMGYTKGIPNFILKPMIVGIISTKSINLMNYSLVETINNNKFIYIRNE
jgi:hypothetical protein